MNIKITLNNNDVYKISDGDIDNELFNSKVEIQTKNNISSFCTKIVLKKHNFSPREGIIFEIDDFKYIRFLANYSFSVSWCEPVFSSKLSDIPENTQAILFDLGDKYRYFLSFSGEKYRSSFRFRDNKLEVVQYSFCDNLSCCDDVAYIVGESNDPYELIENVSQYAASLINNNFKLREEKIYPDTFNYLGWCSWDALHIHIDEKGILKKCEEIKEKNLPIKWILLDDMWSDCTNLNDIPLDISFDEMVEIMHSSRLNNFEADKKRFPHGLKYLFDKIKEYDLIPGVWINSLGYWSGISKDGDYYKNNKDLFIDCLVDGDVKTLVKPEKEAFSKFYSDIFDYVKIAGAEFIKVDFQSSMSYYKNIKPLSEVARIYQNIIENNANKYFNNRLINCMGMSIENMLNRCDSRIIRCSDDFLPNNKKWFTKHMQQCPYNTLFYGPIYTTDWDMFWTNDEQNIKNAILRTLSGGPVYVSDKIGETKKEILDKISFSDSVVLRADKTLIPIKECIFNNPAQSTFPHGIFNYSKGRIALFLTNVTIDNKEVIGNINLSQFPIRTEKVIIYDVFTKAYKLFNKNDSVNIKLKNNDEYKLLTISELKNEFSVIGRTDKYLPPAAIINEDDKKITIYEGGEIAIFSESNIHLITKKRRLLPNKNNNNLYFFNLENDEKEFNIVKASEL